MVLHFVAYFIATGLLYWAFKKDALFSVLIVSFTIFLYSVVLEFVQLYLPYRTFNPMDIAANGVGVVLFVLAWAIFKRNRITGFEEKV
jgi:VanZ family protein